MMLKSFTGVAAATVLLTGCFCSDTARTHVEKALPAPGIAGSSVSAKVNSFFDVGPTASDIKLPADQIFPRGAIFPFSYYSVGGGSLKRRNDLLPPAERDADQKEIMTSGATMLGPQYELNADAPAVAAKYKKFAVYTICPEVDGVKMEGSKSLDKYNLKTLPKEKIIASIAAQVKAVANDPNIAWWNVTPEELRWWRKHEMEFSRIATKAIRDNDPLKRPIMMYEPGHRGADSLTKFTPNLDFISKGMYTNYSGWKHNRGWVRYSMQQEAEARKKLNRPELVLLALPEMFQHVPPEEVKMIPAWVRHDVYASLVSGAQGILVFSASKRPRFEARQDYLNAYMQVSGELTGKQNLGQVFLFGKAMNDLTFQTASGPENIQLKKGKLDVTMPAVAMANIAFNRLRYVVLVNSSNETVRGMVCGLPYGSDVAVSNIWSQDEPFIAPEGEFEVELPPLGVQAYVIYRAK